MATCAERMKTWLALRLVAGRPCLLTGRQAMRLLLVPLLFALHVLDARAALIINSVTLDGAASVTVEPSANITASVNETNTGGSNWRSTRFTTSPASTTQCVDHANRDGNGTGSIAFTIAAPSCGNALGSALLLHFDLQSSLRDYGRSYRNPRNRSNAPFHTRR